MTRLFSAPAHGKPSLFGCLLAGALSLAAASCLGVLQLDTYESASEQICSLYDRCYGPEAFVGCRRHVAGQIETADSNERTDFLDQFADCLDDCQHASSCLDQPMFCGAIREHCAANAQCCGFSAGVAACVGQSCCLVNEAACRRDADCCAGTCAAGKCKGSVAPVCSQLGAACSNNADCCSSICVGSVCASPCNALNSACTIDSDCCSGKCSNGICRKSACSAANELCLSDADCCQDSCDKGRGICGAGGCYADGFPCSQDADCCAGLLCNPADNLCTTLSCTKYGDSCAADADCCGLYCNGSCQCAQIGTACTQAAVYKCCTGVCDAGACADCRPAGMTCTTDAKCCSGTCDKGTCCDVGCSHSLCTVGAALSTKDCSPKNVGAGAASCVSTICAQDPACCCTTWDQSCVDLVASLCNLECP